MIYEYDWVFVDCGGDSLYIIYVLVDCFMVGEFYVVVFGGQGSVWLEIFEELVLVIGIEIELVMLVGEVELLFDLVIDELIVVCLIGFELL